MALGDFNNDGCPDLASVAAAEEGVRAFIGNCKGVWKESSDGLALTDWGNAVEMTDVNGDGNLDIVAAYAAGPRVWLGDGKGRLARGVAGPAGAGHPRPLLGHRRRRPQRRRPLDIVSGSQMPPLPEGCGAPGAPVCAGGGVEAFLQQPDGTWVFANEGFLPMNALGVAIGDLNNDGKPDVVAVGKRALDEIGGVYGVYVVPRRRHRASGRRSRPPGCRRPGKERTWGVGVADIDKDGVLDIAVAFGDVVSPNWHSGAAKKDQKEAKDANAATAPVAPQRGKFGSIEVWRGQLKPGT